MVNDGIDNTVSNGFCYNLFGFFNWIERQFLLNIFHWDFWVGNVQFFQTEFENGMSKSQNQWIVLVISEHFFVSGQDFLEGCHITWLDAVDDLEIWREWLLKVCLREDLPVWNLSHHQLHDDSQLLNLDSKSLSSYIRCLSKSLDQSSMWLRVLQLHSLYSSQVVQISRVLVVWCIKWEIGLYDKLSGLLIKVLLQVWSQNHVGNGCLSDQVLS